MEKAKQAREQAYAPYSGFAVGAALLAASGNIYTGCNVENASYGATICAERVAAANAVSAGERRFSAIAVVSNSEEPWPPCGVCRQVLSEFGSDMTVIMGNLSGKVVVSSLAQLYPGAFGRMHMTPDI